MVDTSKPFTLEAMINSRIPSDVQLSPDGERVAFAVRETYKANKDASTRSTIYLAEVSSGETRPLTGSPDFSNASPHWSPDGRQLAFTSNRGHKDET